MGVLYPEIWEGGDNLMYLKANHGKCKDSDEFKKRGDLLHANTHQKVREAELIQTNPTSEQRRLK